LVNGELRLPTNVTNEQLAQFLGDLYEKGDPSWVGQLFALQQQYAAPKAA
jgi:hypothetical protein